MAVAETFTSFVENAPAAAATSTADKLALVQSGVTKEIDPLALLAAIIEAATVATEANAADSLALLQGGAIKSLTPALLQTTNFPTVITTGATYNVLAADTFLAVNKASLTSIQLPSALTVGRQIAVADMGGSAETYPITVLPGGGDTIEGQSNFALLFAWQACAFEYVPVLSMWKVI